MTKGCVLAAASLLVLLPDVLGYTNLEYGFSFDPPSDWSFVEDSHLLGVFMAPKGDGFASRISLNILDRTRTHLYGYRLPGPMNIQSRAVMTVQDGKAYSLVYTSLHQTYGIYLPEFERMLDTFSISEAVAVVAFMLSAILALKTNVRDF